jgi:hypothetical protein
MFLAKKMKQRNFRYSCQKSGFWIQWKVKTAFVGISAGDSFEGLPNFIQKSFRK